MIKWSDKRMTIWEKNPCKSLQFKKKLLQFFSYLLIKNIHTFQCTLLFVLYFTHITFYFVILQKLYVTNLNHINVAKAFEITVILYIYSFNLLIKAFVKCK